MNKEELQKRKTEIVDEVSPNLFSLVWLIAEHEDKQVALNVLLHLSVNFNSLILSFADSNGLDVEYINQYIFENTMRQHKEAMVMVESIDATKN